MEGKLEMISTEQYDDLCVEYARRYLTHIKRQRESIRSKDIEIDNIREMLSSPGAIRYDKDRVTGTTVPVPFGRDKILDGTAEILEIKMEKEEEKAELEIEYRECIRLLKRLEDPNGSILRCRFLYGVEVEDLAMDYGKSDRWIYARSREGLLDLYPKLPDRYKIPSHAAI